MKPADPLAPLMQRRQWIIARIVPKPDGKTDKIPLHPDTLTAADAHDPANWRDYATAAALVAALNSPEYGIGFVLTAAAGVWVLDIDGCLEADGTWSQKARDLWTRLQPGTVCEVSHSGRGLHVWGLGPVPPHAKRNTAHRLEFYSDRRFILLGPQDIVRSGSLGEPCPAVASVIAEYFPPTEAAVVDVPTEGPRPDWNGPTDDDELLRRALASKSGRKAFNKAGVASFSDLWNANADVLAAAFPPDRSSTELYNASSADLALAAMLAFWTGCDVERIERLMRRSALVREKWDQRSDYLVTRTIKKTCREQQNVLRDPPPKPPAAVAAPLGPPVTGTTADQLPCIRLDDPLNIAQEMVRCDLTIDGLRTLHRWHRAFYDWRPSAWRLASDEEIIGRIYAFASQGHRPAQRHVMPALHALTAITQLDSVTSPPAWLDGRQSPNPADLMPLANGILDLSSGQVLPPTPALWTFNCSPVVFDPHAPAPSTWLRFLADLWPDDPDTITVLQEMFGYLLTPDTRQQKIFLVVGPKRSGKGTIGRVLKELLGPGNVASPSLGSLAERFGLEPLVGKLLALISDARLGANREQATIAENLLRISGEDAVTVDRKNNPAIPSIHLTARVVMLSNEVPRIADASGAMASRFVVMETVQSFYGREDLALTSRLLAELPGILLWAIEGRRRLTRQGHFTQTRAALDAIRQLEDLGSPMLAFVRDVCTLGPALTVPVDALFTAWRQWCLMQGVRGPNDKAGFARDLHAAVPGIKRMELRKGTGREPTYLGLTLRGAAGPGVGGVGPLPFPSPHTTPTVQI